MARKHLQRFRFPDILRYLATMLEEDFNTNVPHVARRMHDLAVEMAAMTEPNALKDVDQVDLEREAE